MKDCKRTRFWRTGPIPEPGITGSGSGPGGQNVQNHLNLEEWFWSGPAESQMLQENSRTDPIPGSGEVSEPDPVLLLSSGISAWITINFLTGEQKQEVLIRSDAWRTGGSEEPGRLVQIGSVLWRGTGRTRPELVLDQQRTGPGGAFTEPGRHGIWSSEPGSDKAVFWFQAGYRVWTGPPLGCWTSAAARPRSPSVPAMR